MSERLTTIQLPGEFGCGLADWGRKTVPEMLATIRRSAAHDMERAKKIIDAADDDFRIYTHTCVYVERNVEVLQEGRPNPRKAAPK